MSIQFVEEMLLLAKISKENIESFKQLLLLEAAGRARENDRQAVCLLLSTSSRCDTARARGEVQRRALTTSNCDRASPLPPGARSCALEVIPALCSCTVHGVVKTGTAVSSAFPISGGACDVEPL